MIVGLDRADDAGVYKVTDDIALIQTVDFFTPVVDDPYWFGQIAAANALSDIYAMGGVPKTAMNLVGFPLKHMEAGILRQILEGGLEKMTEAGVALVGGHSVEDNELKYGLSVTGFVHPDKVLLKKSVKVGDRLILTKPLGTGIINTAIKGGLASAEITDFVTRQMARLNREAAEAMGDHPVHACTDITGFGLLGHLAEMVVGSGYSAEVEAETIPIIPQTLNFAAMGLIPGGAYKNREFRESIVTIADSVDRGVRDVLFDPQTSGGLLICADPDHAPALLSSLHGKGVEDAVMIGRIVPEPTESIHVI